MQIQKKEISTATVAKATGWSFAGEIAGSLISPIINMILARIIAPEVFGIVATVNMVISLANVFTEAGFQLYIVQHNFEDKDELNRYASTALWSSVFIGLAMVLGIFALRDQIAVWVGSPGYGSAVSVASLSIPIVAAISILAAQYRRDFDYKTLFIRRLIVLFVPIIVTVPLALMGLGVWALIFGTIAKDAVNLIILLGNKTYHPGLFFKLEHVKQMAPFCLTTMLNYLLSWATSWLDIFIVSNILGAYYTGLYKNSQSTVIGIISTITSSITPILFNLLSRYQDDEKRFYSVMKEFTEKLSIVLLPLGFGIMACRRLITYVILGPMWMEAKELVGIWGLCTVLSGVYASYCREACRAKGRPILNVIAQSLNLLVILPASYLGAKAGFGTMIYVRSAAMLTLIVFYYIILGRALHINCIGLFNTTRIPLLCSFVMFLILTGVKQLSPSIMWEFVLVALGIGVYFGLICLFPEKRKLLFSVIKGAKDMVLRRRKAKQV